MSNTRYASGFNSSLGSFDRKTALADVNCSGHGAPFSMSLSISARYPYALADSIRMSAGVHLFMPAAVSFVVLAVVFRSSAVKSVIVAALPLYTYLLPLVSYIAM